MALGTGSTLSTWRSGLGVEGFGGLGCRVLGFFSMV